MKKAEFENKNFAPSKAHKPAPKSQGTFRVDARTILEIPSHVVDIEAWKVKMIDKYSNYHERVAISLLTGNAKKLSVSSKLLKATNEL